MRLRSYSATALAAAAIFNPLAFVAAQASPVNTDGVKAVDLVQDGAPADITLATTTHTVTRTVMRVVQTEFATRNSTISNKAVPSLTLTPYYNGTASLLGTGAALSTVMTQSARSMVPSAAASNLGLDVAGLVAAAGIVGVLVF
ncbi:hypothetical protein LTR53_010011 [Teratosphaeriaceae sp. CCFEE 6253]|nr:hypothetical protein LTR53_010011 [Teratosphaeriaceae sp. CCFEE 6253]